MFGRGEKNEVDTEHNAMWAEGVVRNLGDVALPFVTSQQSDSLDCVGELLLRSEASQR